jgi:anti-sigma factor RsiW
MSRRRLEKQVEAYRDGALPASQVERLRRQLETDAEARVALARHEALGRLTREAWRDGPTAPAPEHLISMLRPAMARIDAELDDVRLRRWRGWLTPFPVAALGAAAAAILAFAILDPGTPLPSDPSQRQAAAPVHEAAPSSPPVEAVAVAQPEPQGEIPVYDLAQGDSPLMLFEDGGTTFIWLIEPERSKDDLSALPQLAGRIV